MDKPSQNRGNSPVFKTRKKHYRVNSIDETFNNKDKG